LHRDQPRWRSERWYRKRLCELIAQLSGFLCSQIRFELLPLIIPLGHQHIGLTTRLEQLTPRQTCSYWALIGIGRKHRAVFGSQCRSCPSSAGSVLASSDEVTALLLSLSLHLAALRYPSRRSTLILHQLKTLCFEQETGPTRQEIRLLLDTPLPS
jgi:hypothetical protein